MIQDNLLLILSLLFTITMLAILSTKLRISYPIFLVIGGLLISLVPGIPHISLDPDFVFLLFLPPLLYAAAWNTSWTEFWRMKRPISLLSFGLVIFTSWLVAVVSHAIIPDFSLALGFLLGGIISPPDAVAAASVLEGVRVPKRVTTILEGESLVNDAASLVVFRFALAAIITGQFHFWNASQTFVLVAGLGILIGVAIAVVIYGLHHYFPTTPAIDAAITLISPYIMYIAAEHFHYSGVLSVVSGGLFLTYRSSQLFSYESRIQISGLWSTLVFLLNGLVFILIGLQLPAIVQGLGGYSVGEAIIYAIVISLLTIVIRIVWVYPGAYIPRLFKSVRDTEPYPGWKTVFLVAWSGMRGVVSLASALAIPLTLTNGESFPHRNLILFITFVVILFTLVLQGLSLKPLVKMLNIETHDKEFAQKQELALRVKLAEAVLGHLDEKYSDHISNNDTYKRVHGRYQRMVDVARKKLNKQEDDDVEGSFLPHYRNMLLEIVAVRRQELNKYRHSNEFDEDLIREREWELDLEEARLRN